MSMSKKPKKSQKKKSFLSPKFILIGAASTLLISLFLILGLYLILLNRIYPNISIGGISVGGLTKAQAKEKLTSTLSQRLSSPINFNYQNQSYPITISTPSNLDQVINQAYSFGPLRPRSEASHNKFDLSPQHLPLTLLSTNLLNSQIKSIEQSVNKPAVESVLKVDGEEISVTPSQDGQILDEDTLKSELTSYLNTGNLPSNTLPTRIDYPKLSYQAALGIKQELDSIKDSPLTLSYSAGPNDPDNQTFQIDLPTLLGLLDLNNSRSNLISANLFNHQVVISGIDLPGKHLSDQRLTLDPLKTSAFLQDIATKIDRPVKEPVFTLDQSANGGKGRVTDFQPPTEGKTMDINATYSLLSQRLTSGDLSPIPVVVNTTEPKNKLTNQLGIKELLGEGVSRFMGSSSDRIFNLELAASRINGALVPPGETFSFDQTVGDISAANGYHQGYVIKSGKTVLDDGGGVCQDPTTLFRAVLNAGLPVVARTAHAYRVYYYEEGFPPGIDATIFQPSVDFKFKNDTPNYILIQTSWNNATDTLYYDLWGTSDGRISKVSTPVILSSSPAPPDEHQPDPTKPKGSVTQIDFASGGARVVFGRTVTKEGQTLIDENFYSNYTPQANVYLEGTL